MLRKLTLARVCLYLLLVTAFASGGLYAYLPFLAVARVNLFIFLCILFSRCFVWHSSFGATAVSLSWIGLVLFMRKFPKLGIYVVMFTDIFKTFAQFFVVCFLFIVAFGLGFHILLFNQVRLVTLLVTHQLTLSVTKARTRTHAGTQLPIYSVNSISQSIKHLIKTFFYFSNFW